MTPSSLLQKFATGLTLTSAVVGVSLMPAQKASALSLSDFAAGGSVTSTNGYQAVPEPITMLGAGVAIASGAAFKRRNLSQK